MGIIRQYSVGGFVVFLLPLQYLVAWDETGNTGDCVVLEPSTTQVLIATVYLKIPRLCAEGDKLIGTYELKVPLRSSKSESGTMWLKLDRSPEYLLENGGTIYGVGKSEKDNEPDRMIECIIYPPEKNSEKSETLGLIIDTGNRVLQFETAFTWIEQAEVEKLAISSKN